MSTVLRRQPSQGRSSQRFDLILDTMALLIDEVGYAGISISMIAKRGNMTGPAVYRYFDDLHSIARALASRNRERYLGLVDVALEDQSIDWHDAMRLVTAAYASMFRTERGFRWLRLGDELERNLPSDEQSARAIVSELAVELFVERFNVDYRLDLVAHVEVMIEFADALIARAFLIDPDGDVFFLNECDALLIRYLGDYLEKPYAEQMFQI